MVDYADQLLSGHTGKKAQPKKSGVDWADLILGPGLEYKKGEIGGEEGTFPVQTGRTPTGEVSTITTKPMYKRVPYEAKEASFGAITETGFVDDPETQMNILSKRIGIPRERFGIVDGEVMYRADDGNVYPAMPKGPKRTIAKQIPRIPAMVGGAVGTLGGPGTAALLAAGGESIRKNIGSLVYGEKQTSLENIGDMALEAGLTYTGEKIGGRLIKGIDRTKGKMASELMDLSSTERMGLHPKAIENIENLAKQFDIDLFVPQTTKSYELIANFSLLGDLPVTADKIGRARIKQLGQVNKAVGKWLDEFAPPSTTPGEAGRRTVEAAGAAMEAPAVAARKASKSLYEDARKVAGVDISDTVTEINEMLKLAPTGGAEKKSLTRIKNMLFTKELDDQGKEILVPQDKIAVLDKVKKEINGMWKKDPKTAPDKEAKAAINKTLKNMLTTIDKQAPQYKAARKAYQETIEARGADALKKTQVAQLAKLEGDKVEGAAKMVFSPSSSSPEIVGITKEAVIREGGQGAWDALLRVHLKNKLREVVKTNTMNVGGMLRKKLFMDMDQKDILKAAMTKQQFLTFTKFMQVLERTGLTAGKESATAPRLISAGRMAERAQGLSGKVTRAIAYPLYSWKRILADFRLRMNTESYQKMLADAMLDPKNSVKFRKMLQLKPKSIQQMKMLSTFLTSLGGGVALKGMGKLEGEPPPKLRSSH